MNKKPNILLEVAALSMRLSSKYLQPYSTKYSPQKFTQSQLLTCLILRAYLKTTYRGLIEFLEASSELRKVLQLKRLPHYSTLKYFADRPNVAEISNVLMAVSPQGPAILRRRMVEVAPGDCQSEPIVRP